MFAEDYSRRISAALESLGIHPDIVARRNMGLQEEARELMVAQTDPDGREFHLLPSAAAAWWEMQAAAARDGVAIELVSAFRGVDRQVEIIRAKLERGLAIDTIFTLSAPPGYSEHHTGRAIDINTPGCAPTEEEFEHTEAYRWLCEHAGRFEYTLSYPRGNQLGFIYEPWHWLHRRA